MHIKCQDGYKMRGTRCLKVKGKAAEEAKRSLQSRMPGASHNARKSNEAKQELRGKRKIKGYSPSSDIKTMKGGGGAQGIVSGGSDFGLMQTHGDKYLKKEIPNGKKISTVTGGTGYRGHTPSNSTIVTDPMKGRTPAIIKSKGAGVVDAGYSNVIKQTVRQNGDGHYKAANSGRFTRPGDNIKQRGVSRKKRK